MNKLLLILLLLFPSLPIADNITRNPNNMMLITASSNNYEFVAMIDTGSSTVALNKSTIANIPHTFKQLVNVILANGQTRTYTSVTIPSITILECTLLNIEVVVFPNDDHNNIIGLNVLEKLMPLTFTINQLTGSCINS